MYNIKLPQKELVCLFLEVTASHEENIHRVHGAVDLFSRDTCAGQGLKQKPGKPDRFMRLGT